MEPTREEIRQWLEAALKKTNETPSALARRAGLATTTLTRFLNDPHAPMLTLRSLAKVAHAADIQPLGLPQKKIVPSAGYLSESEAEPYRFGDEGTLDLAIKALIGDRTAADPWLIKTRSLDLAGLLPGDIVIVDLNERAVSGDVVCAQAYQWEKSLAETVFRLYEPPYLVAATSDAALAASLRKPLLVDHDAIIIKGVVIDALRRLRAVHV